MRRYVLAAAPFVFSPRVATSPAYDAQGGVVPTYPVEGVHVRRPKKNVPVLFQLWVTNRSAPRSTRPE